VGNHFVAASGEFVGTFLFLYFGFAAHLMAVEQTDAVALANGQKSAQTVVYISLGYGFSLLVTVWAFYQISGGLFNLAVSVLLFFFSLLWRFAMLEGEGGARGDGDREGKGGGGSKVLERDTSWQPQVTLGTCLAG
jgi:Major intrinsic protein